MPKETIGTDILLFTENEAGEEIVLGGQRNATLNRDVEDIDATSKLTYGWTDMLPGNGSWGIDCDGIFMEDDTSLAMIEELFENKEPLKVKMKFPSGRSKQGLCKIGSFPIEAPMGDVATYSLTLQGKGKYQNLPAADAEGVIE